jgi:hypothetical protein
MSTQPDHGAQPEWNPRYFRDRNGNWQRFNHNAEIRAPGYHWTSRPDDYPPDEDMVRVEWISRHYDDPPGGEMIRVEPPLYVLWGHLDSCYNRIPRRKAKAWLEARQAFARGKYFEPWYANLPPDLLGDLSEDEDPPGAAGGRRDPGEWRTLDDLTKAAWKLLQAMLDLGATDSGKAVGREEIAAKAGVGHANSQHIEAIFKGLKRLGLVVSRQNAGTWLTEAGIEAISRRGPA